MPNKTLAMGKAGDVPAREIRRGAIGVAKRRFFSGPPGYAN